MSADNWTSCPACFAVAIKKFDTSHAEIMSNYGKVSVEQFDEARAALAKPKAEDFKTFREDYEIYGAEYGTVEVSYHGHCSACGLGIDFQHARKFWPEATP